MSRITIGTRGSRLALVQATQVAERLLQTSGETEVRLETITTQGDLPRAAQPSGTPMKGLFVKALEDALLRGDIDCAIHSLKDLPVEDTGGVTVVAVLEREDARDVFLARDGTPLARLPAGAVVGTSSPRRRAQLQRVRADLSLRDLHGNVDTRLRKLEGGEYDAIVLAAAGLKRLGCDAAITEYLDLAVFVPSPGQGAIAVQARADDARVRALLAPLNHSPTQRAVRAETACVRHLGGGCSLPLGAYVAPNGPRLHLRAMVASLDGRRALTHDATGAADDPAALGACVAETLLDAGARELLDGTL